MDGDIKDTLRDIRDAVKDSRAEIGAKLDVHSKQFQQHLIDDTKAFTILELGQKQLREEMIAADQRRKEESERRLQKVKEEQATKAAETLAQKAGRYAIWAAMLGSLALWILEHFIKK